MDWWDCRYCVSEGAGEKEGKEEGEGRRPGEEGEEDEDVEEEEDLELDDYENAGTPPQLLSSHHTQTTLALLTTCASPRGYVRETQSQCLFVSATRDQPISICGDTCVSCCSR